MSEPFLAEIRMLGFHFAPRNWAQCDGQELPIAQNQSLYSLLGTTYGGDGKTTFALPDLRGRTPIHVGASDGLDHPLGEKGGEETHVLSIEEMPEHTHHLRASDSNADTPVPQGNVLANVPVQAYRAAGNMLPMVEGSVVTAGGDQPHNNMQPGLVVNFCIALQGLYPPRS